MALEPIKIGAVAPDFELPSSEIAPNGKPGKKLKLGDYRGQNVVIAFFPLAFSPVCTGENACFQHMIGDFTTAGAQVLGVSVDSAWSLAAFKQQLGLAYPLLADFNPRGAVARQYGLFLEESGITARATVVVGRDGKVAYVKVQQIPEPRSNQEILAFVRTMG